MANNPDGRKSDRHDAVGSSTDRHKIQSLEDAVYELKARLTVVEAELNTGKVVFAEVKKDMLSMKESLDGVKTVLGRLNWTIIAAVVVAVLGLVLKGHADL